MGFIEKIYIILKYCDEYLHLLFIQNISLFLIGSNGPRLNIHNQLALNKLCRHFQISGKMTSIVQALDYNWEACELGCVSSDTLGCVGKAGENGSKFHTSCGEEEAELKPKNAARTAKIQVNGVIPDLGYANVCYKSLQCKVSLDY